MGFVKWKIFSKHKISYDKGGTSGHSSSTVDQNISPLISHFLDPFIILLEEINDWLFWKVSNIMLLVHNFLKFMLEKGIFKWREKKGATSTDSPNFQFFNHIFIDCSILVAKIDSLKDKISFRIECWLIFFVLNQLLVLFCIASETNKFFMTEEWHQFPIWTLLTITDDEFFLLQLWLRLLLRWFGIHFDIIAKSISISILHNAMIKFW